MTVDIYAATDGTAGGNGSRSMPYDLATALTAQAANERLVVMPGIYEQAATIGAGLLVEGHHSGRPILYGGVQITGTWSNYSGNVWRIATANPVASSLGCLILRTHSNGWLSGEYMDALGEVTEDREWYHDGTYLYLYSSDGDPSVAYWRVDKASLTGTASIYYAPATGGLYVGQGKDGVTLRNLGVYGFRGNGHLVDDCDAHVIDGCRFAYNAEDGGGGFSAPNNVVSDCTFDWNGTRRVRLGEFGATDGDGYSLHNQGGGPASTNTTIRDCSGEGNRKDLIQNVNDSTGTIERCTAVNCGFGFVMASSGAQTFRNIVVRAGDLGVLGFAVVTGTGTLHNATIVGRNQASSKALVSIAGAGSLTMRNCIVSAWPTGSDMLTTTFVHTYNCWNVTTLGHTLSTGEIQDHPELTGNRYGITSTSPCAETGTDLSATFTDDRYGRQRPAGLWSMGAVELVTLTHRDRVMAGLATALERIGDTSQAWQTLDALTGVVRRGRLQDDLQEPYVAIESTEEQYERVAVSGVYSRTLRVALRYVAPSDWESFDWIGAATHDVELAIGTDRTLGGVCNDATFISNVSRVDGADSAVAFTVDIRYRTLETSPLTRV